MKMGGKNQLIKLTAAAIFGLNIVPFHSGADRSKSAK
jgi:hypothetical protein